ncbi:hypothetical protein Btru_027823 [Bulinus truncatus]|nr:hypothetical protein Btru_027823 [Bulinus truncatus]
MDRGPNCRQKVKVQRRQFGIEPGEGRGGAMGGGAVRVKQPNHTHQAHDGPVIVTCNRKAEAILATTGLEGHWRWGGGGKRGGVTDYFLMQASNAESSPSMRQSDNSSISAFYD